MNVRDLEISLRPRRGWESTDLGFLVTREYFRDLFRIGLYGFVPFWILLTVVCWKIPGLSLFIIWWLKPIYDRFYLHYFSRRIFGEKIAVKEVLRQAPRLLFKRSFSLLTWERLSPSRSMLLPIRDLEALKGRAYGERAHVIKRVGGGNAVIMMSSIALAETILILSIISIIASYNPQLQFVVDSGESGGVLKAFTNYVTVFYTHWSAKVLMLVAPCFVFLLFEPFYVGAGFCLYLNSRSTQEAWDVELRFKEFATRLKKSVISVGKSTPLIIVLGILLLSTPSAQAEEPASGKADAQQVVEVVYEDPAFTVHTRKVPIPKERKKKKRKKSDGGWLFGDSLLIGSLLNGVFKSIAILAVTALLVLIGYLIYKVVANREVQVNADRRKKSRPDTIMGMEVTRESLPPNLLEVARSAWRQGDHKKALSLLYRAALTDIIIDYDAEIDASDTEYQCQRAARKVLDDAQSAYFSTLTKSWISVAYSQFIISEEAFENLCNKWIFKLS